MDLSKYEKKYVRIKSIYGDTYTGLASYGNYNFLMCEYGGKEDGIFIDDFLIYNSQISFIEEIEAHGTAELRTQRLILRKYKPEDAEPLYRRMGMDPEMYRYSGWNPYETLEMAQGTVHKYISSYDDEHVYSWVMDVDGVVVGTIGAYDCKDDRIEVGFSVVTAWQGRGIATEALKEVLRYLVENEGISCVTAWCADKNVGSQHVLEKAGLRHIRTEKENLIIGGRVYDKMIYEYREET